MADVGFDLEIWNELAFGSNFLDVNLYYNPPLYPKWDSDLVWYPLNF